MGKLIIHILFVLLCGTLTCSAQDTDALTSTADADVSAAVSTDSTAIAPKKTSFFKKMTNGVVKFIDQFSTYDTTYIEPQHYKFQVMGQMTSNFEGYTMETKDGQAIRLSPGVSTKFGPYAGYSLIFLGYTLQLNNLYIGSDMKTLNLSLYTALLGFDLYYKNNSNFKINMFELTDGDSKVQYNTDGLLGNSFTGLNVKYWGFNAYYIVNHLRHSYPAAYNQSTCQKKSAGSPLFGFGYGHYNLSMDWQQLYNLIQTYYPDYKFQMSEEAHVRDINYSSYSLYGGYSYNWVFARNWLLGASATMALSYNKTSGSRFYDDFRFTNLGVDGLGRIGIVWNNTRWFAGASGMLHSYTYKKEQFSVNNLFGTVNVYFGINFGKKKQYRKPGKFFEF